MQETRENTECYDDAQEWLISNGLICEIDCKNKECENLTNSLTKLLEEYLER